MDSPIFIELLKTLKENELLIDKLIDKIKKDNKDKEKINVFTRKI